MMSKKHNHEDYEVVANLAFFKNLKMIDENRNNSKSIFTNNSQTSNLELEGDNLEKENVVEISNQNIKKFLKNIQLDETKTLITNISGSNIIDEKNLDEEVEEKNNINNKKLKIIKGQLFNKYEKNKKTSIGKLDIGIFQILNLIFCRCKKNVKKNNLFLDECTNVMGNYLDYLRILKLFKEFNRMKKILFSNSQLKLFSYLPKPNLRYKNDELKIDNLYGDIFTNDKSNKNKNNNNHIQYSKLFESYVKILGQKPQCDNEKKINKRMITFMDNEMKDCFEDVVNGYLEQITE